VYLKEGYKILELDFKQFTCPKDMTGYNPGLKK
jgi:hypothetical protein